jgi:small basic protein (TIGR04137 family)
MSLDRSLKSGGSLIRHRNVLTRAERLEVLAEEENWQDGGSVFGLPKVAHRKLATGKKQKKAKTEEEVAAEGQVGGEAAAAGTKETTEK